MAQKLERVGTGITGLDNLLQGGFLKGSANMVSGTAGAGKTIFCLQFLLEGLKSGENCMFVSFEETPIDIKRDALVFGWDLEPYEKQGKLFIDHRRPLESENLLRFRTEISKYKITRVALDSTSVLSMACKTPYEIRQSLYSLVEILKKSEATSVFTTEVVYGKGDRISRFGVEEFLADSVIMLRSVGIGFDEKGMRSLQVIKARSTKHSEDAYPLEITGKGIVVKKV